MEKIKSIPYDKKLITAIADYILTFLLPSVKKGLVLIFDDIVDTHYIRFTFNEWEKILTSVFDTPAGQLKIYSLFKHQQELDYDSIIDLAKLTSTNGLTDDPVKVLVLLQKSVLEFVVPRSLKPVRLCVNKPFNFNNFLDTLICFGYVRVEHVESIGEFSVRGSIIDIWPNGSLKILAENQTVCDIEKFRVPVRIVLDGDVISQIKQLDVTTQRSISQMMFTEVEIYPVNFKKFFEPLLGESFTDEKSKLYDLLKEKEFELVNCLEEESQGLTFTEINFNYFPTARYYGNIEIFLKDITDFSQKCYKIVLGYNYEYELSKLKEIISVPSLQQVDTNLRFVSTKLTNGFYSPQRKLLFITYPEIFSKYEIFGYHIPRIYRGIRLENVWEIQPEDYVVHKEFGIAKFRGIKMLSIGGVNKEFLELYFKDNAVLYVPITELDSVEKYISLSDKPPTLSSLNRESWQRTVKRIKESIKEFIIQLYTLYTQRKKLPGISFLGDEKLETMFAETFEYEETEDQKNAIKDVLSDMQKPYPMDRIIVGDVGFGKTEVALRATFRAVLNKKQVLVLCPTTVLAEQHYRTFSERLQPFGIKVAVVTRLQRKQDVAQTLKDLAEGKVDVVIGTHILLKDNVKFYDLGLVIIDEEHKFGVKQKEKIRTKYKEVNTTLDSVVPDTLSLSATPIPRSLAFGLEGIKDISVIETPPEGRLPIETFVLPYDENILVEAINRELHRNGQVYYVFNNIQLIEHKTLKLKQYFPSVNIEFIHSKLPSRKIEDTMIRFLNEDIKILVTTTIIESGLDIPNVNTIIIENVENFGLAQLYQLRGRVGRRTQKAYCYLFYSPDLLTTNAKKRLAAIMEFTSLGSGFRLALRDLEIRGAGEILGTKQHGFVNEIGLSMYSRVIQQIVSELSGKEYYEFLPKINIEIDAGIPPEYIESTETRVIFYRKLLDAKTFSQLEDTLEEMYDRFGKPQDTKQRRLVENLLLLCRLRIVMRKYGIQEVSKVGDRLILKLYDDTKLARIVDRLKRHNIDLEVLADSSLGVLLKGRNLDDSVSELTDSLL